MVLALLVVFGVALLIIMYMQYRMMKQLLEHSKKLSGLVQSRQSSITRQSIAAQQGVRPDLMPQQPHSDRMFTSSPSGRQTAGIKMRKVGGDDG